MTKEEFLKELENRLKGLPKEDLKDHINFYDEAIEDRMYEGKSEEEAISDLGSIDDIINEIAKEYPLTKLVKEKVKPKRRLSAFEVIIAVLGFPLWFPLVLTFFILCLVFYLLVWVFALASYVIEISLVVASIGSLLSYFMYLSEGTNNLVAIGSFIMCLGGAILFIFACIGITKGTIILSKKIIVSIKKSFIKKGSK